ncbi:MAG: guanylate kinase [Planctomycetota bacterium]|jgi:guanylate kinase
MSNSSDQQQFGKLIIISGPSGSGKSTIVAKLIETCPLPLELSVSATTRPPRPGEIHGKQYWFLSPEEFQQKRSQGEFLECKEVFGRGFWYGTLKKAVSSGLSAGKWIILEIDVQGALAVLDYDPKVITIFIDPGSMEQLERRLRDRGTETEEAIERRLQVAREEMGLKDHYRHSVTNDILEDTVSQVCRLLCQYDTRPNQAS